MAASQAKSGGNKKIGRNVKKCELYYRTQRRYKNKIRKVTKWTARLPVSTQERILANVKMHRGE